jgi:GPH family glycoside/pentoside/hexuronide:cation symporter
MENDLPTAAPHAHPSHKTPPEDRVPGVQKIGYGMGTFFDMWGHWLYPTIAFQIFGLFLHVPFWQIGLAVILNRVFDAVSDPVFGWLSDNARSRWGRRRPYMAVGTVLAGLGLPFLLAVTTGWSGTSYFVFMLASSALYLPMVSCFNMPYQSLANELTPDYHERTSVFAFKNAFQKIPELGLFFFGRFFSMAVWVGADARNLPERLGQLFTTTAAWSSAPDGAHPNQLLGAQVYLALCGLIMVVAGFTCVMLVRERYYGRLVAGKQGSISIKDTLWLTLRCRPFLLQKVMDLGYNTGLSMVGTLGLADTIYYVCGGNKSVGNLWNFYMGVSGMVLGFLGIPAFALVARRVGKLRAMGAVLGSAIAVFIASWWLYTPHLVWLQVFASGFIAFIGAGYWTIAGSIGADVMDYDELEGGRRREGSFAACGSWINKVAMAGGAGISFFILQWIGLDDSIDHQSAHAIFMIRFLFASIPIIGLTFALIALQRFPLSQQRMAEIRQQLEARRGKV